MWLFAPLSGILVQPVIGVLSDNSTLVCGRRRPFIALGALGSTLSMLSLAWANTIAKKVDLFFLVYSGDNGGKQIISSATCACLSLIMLNICIQPIQVGLRSLVVDSIPRSQQASATAWTSSAVGAGNMLAHVNGSAGLEKTLNMSRYQYLTLVSCTCLLVTVFLCCVFVSEQPPDSSLSGNGSAPSLVDELSSSYGRIHWTIKGVFQIQFFSWMSWFPILFYSSKY